AGDPRARVPHAGGARAAGRGSLCGRGEPDGVPALHQRPPRVVLVRVQAHPRRSGAGRLAGHLVAVRALVGPRSGRRAFRAAAPARRGHGPRRSRRVSDRAAAEHPGRDRWRAEPGSGARDLGDPLLRELLLRPAAARLPAGGRERLAQPVRTATRQRAVPPAFAEWVAMTTEALERWRAEPVGSIRSGPLSLPLRRYGDPKAGRSVLLLHGANTGSDMFLLPGGGIVKYLADRRFDVWTLDWRGSPEVMRQLQDVGFIEGSAARER